MHSVQKSMKRGFTLIELLVVIAIIAILAAILFPAFARARENARRASCSSNLKQIALGVMQYTQDYDEKYPMWFQENSEPRTYPDTFVPVATGAGGPGADVGWMELMQPYLKSKQLFQCPSEGFPESPEGDMRGNQGTLKQGYSDYTGNFYPTALGAANMASVKAPAQTVMVTDWRSHSSGSSHLGSTLWTSFPMTADTGQADQFHRHLGGNNFAFADGHVKWLKPEKVRSSDGAIYTCGTGGTASPDNWAYTFCKE